MVAKPIVRTIRMTSELDALIREEAKKRRVTVSALVDSILRDYVDWYRILLKTDWVIIDQQTLRSLLDLGNEEDLMRIGKAAGLNAAGTLSLFGKHEDGFSIDSSLDICERYSAHNRTGRYEITKSGDIRTLKYTTNLGEKWANVMKYVWTEILHAFGLTAERIETKGSTLITEFSIGKTHKSKST